MSNLIMKLVIFGATGRIGSNLLRSALDKGHEVLAIARHPENIKVKHDNLQVKNVNIFDEALMAEEFQGKDAIVSCLGASGSFLNRTPVTLYTETAKVFSGAMRKSGASRLVVMAAWYVEGYMPLYLRAGVTFGWKNVVQNQRAMEVYLQENSTDLDYTVVKILFGKGQNESGKPVLTHEGQSVPGGGRFITYGDLSKFIIETCISDGEWKKKIVSITGG